MPGFIYIPFPNYEMRNFANRWTQGQAAKGKPPYQILAPHDVGCVRGIVRLTGRGVLRVVGAADKLYIMAHGAYDLLSATIDSDRGYSPKRLAGVLEREGLTKAIADLRVFACGSAMPDENSARHRTYAGDLLEEMRKTGYGQVVVSGYMGDTFPSYRHRTDAVGLHKGVEVEEGRRVFTVRAKDQRTTFS